MWTSFLSVVDVAWNLQCYFIIKTYFYKMIFHDFTFLHSILSHILKKWKIYGINSYSATNYSNTQSEMKNNIYLSASDILHVKSVCNLNDQLYYFKFLLSELKAILTIIFEQRIIFDQLFLMEMLLKSPILLKNQSRKLIFS